MQQLFASALFPAPTLLINSLHATICFGNSLPCTNSFSQLSSHNNSFLQLSSLHQLLHATFFTQQPFLATLFTAPTLLINFLDCTNSFLQLFSRNNSSVQLFSRNTLCHATLFVIYATDGSNDKGVMGAGFFKLDEHRGMQHSLSCNTPLCNAYNNSLMQHTSPAHAKGRHRFYSPLLIA